MHSLIEHFSLDKKERRGRLANLRGLSLGELTPVLFAQKEKKKKSLYNNTTHHSSDDRTSISLGERGF